MKKLILTVFSISTLVMGLPAQVQTEIFTVVEKMPIYPGCEDFIDRGNRANCTDRKIMQFIAENTEYPKAAIENKVVGTVYVSFVVDTSGQSTNIRVVRGIEGEYGKLLNEESKRVIGALPKMISGEQRGRKVKVQYTRPLKFKLPVEEKSEEE